MSFQSPSCLLENSLVNSRNLYLLKYKYSTTKFVYINELFCKFTILIYNINCHLLRIRIFLIEIEYNYANK